jgi:GntR family transcriptional regulator
MTEIDPSSSTPISEQILERFRFQIATGQFTVGEVLPSTRSLASRLGVSFHTVRKAYQLLAELGLVASRPGIGYAVIEHHPAEKQERLELGADVMADAVERLVSFGLEEAEMEYLFQEQLLRLSTVAESAKIIFVASFTEFAEHGARRVAEHTGLRVDAVALPLLDGHTDADYAITPFPIARSVQTKLPNTDVIGVRTELPAAAVALASRLFDSETLLLVVRYSDAIPVLTRRLRNDAGFGGQIIAMVMEEGDSRLGAVVRQADGVLYTPDTRRRMRPHLAAAPTHTEVQLSLSRAELDRLRVALPQ